MKLGGNDEFTKFEYTNKIRMTSVEMTKRGIRFVIASFEFHHLFVNSNFVIGYFSSALTTARPQSPSPDGMSSRRDENTALGQRFIRIITAISHCTSLAPARGQCL